MVFLVNIKFRNVKVQYELNETIGLIETAGEIVENKIEGSRLAPDPSTFIGIGKIKEIKEKINKKQKTLVFNHNLSPSQQRNIEKKTLCQVVDRTALILDIFACKAKTREAKLQVELAQLEYLTSRLVRGWTHLERQKGGIGLRGPGEKQLETDRRLIRFRIKSLKSKLKKVLTQRSTQRKARKKSRTYSVCLVGYTNAGKSSLFNKLTSTRVPSENKLFSTLETTSRKYVNIKKNIIISDTVGFIKDLPHTLIASFRSTLYEAIEADLLLHVVDFSNENKDLQVNEVNHVLSIIGASNIPKILIYNKIDKTCNDNNISSLPYDKIKYIKLSAKTGEGLNVLHDYIDKLIINNYFNRLEEKKYVNE